MVFGRRVCTTGKKEMPHYSTRGESSMWRFPGSYSSVTNLLSCQSKVSCSKKFVRTSCSILEKAIFKKSIITVRRWRVNVKLSGLYLLGTHHLPFSVQRGYHELYGKCSFRMYFTEISWVKCNEINGNFITFFLTLLYFLLNQNAHLIAKSLLKLHLLPNKCRSTYKLKDSFVSMEMFNGLLKVLTI